MRALPADLAADAAAIQRVKAPEFHNLGLVLGYSYAGSPVVQPGGGAAVADVARYTPSAEPGARLPHCWLPDGSSLYDTLGAGFTLVAPAGASDAAVLPLSERARALRIPLTVTAAPRDYPWQGEFLLVRPDQHIAWRAGDPAGIDLAAAVGALPVRGRAGVRGHGSAQAPHQGAMGGGEPPVPGVPGVVPRASRHEAGPSSESPFVGPTVSTRARSVRLNSG
jgi:hypothetical protein